jgi:hypothetical protein
MNLVDSYMLVERKSDQSEALGHIYPGVAEVVRSVSKHTGKDLAELEPRLVSVQFPGLPPIVVTRIEYPGYLGSGGPKHEYYACLVPLVGYLLAALYRRQQGEVEVTPGIPRGSRHTVEGGSY